VTLRSFQGRSPRLGPGVFVADSAEVIGDVTLGADASVWYGTVIRGDGAPIRVGARTNVQDLSVLHVTAGRGCTVGDDVTIGHRAIVHACVVEDRCLIGMGAIVLDGAVIGAESIVGAGALVPAGMQVPPRSLVLGVPATVKRHLGDADVASIADYGRTYVGLKDAHLPSAGPAPAAVVDTDPPAS